MRLPARTPTYVVRLLAGLVPLSVLVVAVSGKQPFAGAPSVSAPAPSVHGNHVKLQNPLPAPAPLGADKNGQKNNNHDKYPETGPELSLGECVAIALERNPALKALQHSTAATEAG